MKGQMIQINIKEGKKKHKYVYLRINLHNFPLTKIKRACTLHSPYGISNMAQIKFLTSYGHFMMLSRLPNTQLFGQSKQR